MNRSEIETQVIDVVSKQLGVDKSEIKLESSFANDLNADSLDTVELVMNLEDDFSVTIPEEEAEAIQTVGKAVDFIVDAKIAELRMLIKQGKSAEQIAKIMKVDVKTIQDEIMKESVDAKKAE